MEDTNKNGRKWALQRSWLIGWLAVLTFCQLAVVVCCCRCWCSIATAQRYGSTMRVCAIEGMKQDSGVHECLKE
ncbi:hypothetical protein M747DRAFT_58288 [Aspergillus niger ATCC 13496]|uniref:Uncharacterized protein n=1 Tax=Aspergillus niger ATCC 13496 TaxID=1353008 RepID=A0A370CCB3_ASPNG|nr:hypothetical protein M747DRAFT_58288 [Aspergillus niger ATCC 13496]